MTDIREHQPVPDRVRPVVQLIGENGNVYNTIGLTLRALRSVSPALAAEFKQRAFNCHDYDEVLRLVMEYCEVE